MGTASRGKWLRRVERAKLEGREQGERENRRWHASWIIAGILALAVAWITAGSGLAMIPVFVISVAFALLTISLLWVATPRPTHIYAKWLISAALLVFTALELAWTYKNDRPILVPAMGGFATQNYKSKWFALHIETQIQNTGMQSGFAYRWKLKMDVNGKSYEGMQLFGQQRPAQLVIENEINDQEFPPGKPVRGWLFFAFPDLKHTDMEQYFACDSALAKAVNITLTATDSKYKKEFSQRRNLEEMREESCDSLIPDTKTP